MFQVIWLFENQSNDLKKTMPKMSFDPPKTFSFIRLLTKFNFFNAFCDALVGNLYSFWCEQTQNQNASAKFVIIFDFESVYEKIRNIIFQKALKLKILEN